VPTANSNIDTSTTKISPDEEKRKIKEFEEREKERFENEIQRLTIRHMKQLEEYRIKADNIMKDLDDEQRLKRKQLVDAETKCLKDVDDRYNQEYGYWQNRLRSRKQKLEEDFKKEDAERSQFYQNVLNLNSSNNSSNNYGTTSPNPNYYNQSHMSNASSIGSSSSSSYSGVQNHHHQQQQQQQYYYTMNQQQAMSNHAAQNPGYATLGHPLNGLNCASPSIMQQQMSFNSANGNMSGMSNAESYFNGNNSSLGQYVAQGNAPMLRKGNEF
jgi:hypothetical protein